MENEEELLWALFFMHPGWYKRLYKAILYAADW